MPIVLVQARDLLHLIRTPHYKSQKQQLIITRSRVRKKKTGKHLRHKNVHLWQGMADRNQLKLVTKNFNVAVNRKHRKLMFHDDI